MLASPCCGRSMYLEARSWSGMVAVSADASLVGRAFRGLVGRSGGRAGVGFGGRLAVGRGVWGEDLQTDYTHTAISHLERTGHADRIGKSRYSKHHVTLGGGR